MTEQSKEKSEKIEKSTKKKRRSGKYSKSKGNKYELQIVNELKAMGYDAVTSRSESKRMDDAKVDVITNFPFHIQCKNTQVKPDYIKIINEFKLTDKPLIIFHNSQVKKKVNCVSLGEFAILRKEYLYNLIKNR